MNALTIRRAQAGEEALVLTLLHELAVYERIAGKFRITASDIARDFLGPEPRCFCELAFDGPEPAGVMTWYPIYSSFAAARGIFLEDLFVRPAQRGKGLGRALLVHLARQAAAEGARYIDWYVLDWNKPSIDFYERLGAEPVKGWLSYRLAGAALDELSHA